MVGVTAQQKHHIPFFDEFTKLMKRIVQTKNSSLAM
jgi:hypothetical protein